MIRRFLKSQKGETLIETLVSLLIIVIIGVMLPAAIVAASNINKQAESIETSCTLDTGSEQSGYTVDVDGTTLTDVKVYESEGFLFYDYD